MIEVIGRSSLRPIPKGCYVIYNEIKGRERSDVNYLFFDTESSNCFNNLYKMCEWGSLMTDSSFRLIPDSKRDILIDPGSAGKFHLKGRKGRPDLVLAHSHSQYRNAPKFDVYYDELRRYIQQEGILIFLWSSENDIQALLDQCRRYDLPKISFVSYDVQVLFQTFIWKCKRLASLGVAMEALHISKEGIAPHRPDDDSLMTMLVLKAIVEKTGKNVAQLIQECPQCKLESIATYENMMKAHKKRMERQRLSNERKKALKSLNDELNAIFERETPSDTPLERRFSISNEMKMHLDEVMGVTKEWMGRGYILRRCLNVGYLVCYNEKEKAKLESQLDLSVLKLVTRNEFDEITKTWGN